MAIVKVIGNKEHVTYEESDPVVQQFRISKLCDRINEKNIDVKSKISAISEYRLRAELYNKTVGFNAFDLEYCGGFTTVVNGEEIELDYFTGKKIEN